MTVAGNMVLGLYGSGGGYDGGSKRKSLRAKLENAHPALSTALALVVGGLTAAPCALLTAAAITGGGLFFSPVLAACALGFGFLGYFWAKGEDWQKREPGTGHKPAKDKSLGPSRSGRAAQAATKPFRLAGHMLRSVFGRAHDGGHKPSPGSSSPKPAQYKL